MRIGSALNLMLLPDAQRRFPHFSTLKSQMAQAAGFNGLDAPEGREKRKAQSHTAQV